MRKFKVYLGRPDLTPTSTLTVEAERCSFMPGGVVTFSMDSRPGEEAEIILSVKDWLYFEPID